MKRIVAIAFCLVCASFIHAQKTDALPAPAEVLAKYVKATGGAEAYKAVKSRRVTGKMDVQPMGITGKLVSSTGPGGKFYVEIEMKGLGKEIMGSDGETHWSKSQFTGTRIIDGDEAQAMVVENDLLSVLHQEKYYKDIKVTGIEKVDDEDHYRLEKVNKVTGKKHTVLYSVKSGLSTKTVMPAVTPVGNFDVEVMISDYRKAGDLLMSHKSKQKLPVANAVQTMTIDKVELNPELDDSIFELPEEIVKLKAKAAEKAATEAGF